MRVALAAAVLALAVACGSSTKAPPPPPTDSGGSGGGGSGGGGSGGSGGDTSGGQPAGGSDGGVSPGGGTSGDGGSAPAGGGSGGSDAGTAGGSSGGGSAGGTAQPPAPPSDSSATVTRLDSSPECDGLLPARVPAPVSAALPPPQAPYTCGRGTSEGGGHVAVATPMGTTTRWQFLSPDGKPEQSVVVESPLYPQADGWQGAIHGLSGGSGSYSLHVLTFAADGSLRRDEAIDGVDVDLPWRLYESAPGGSLLHAWIGSGCQVFRIGADGARVGAPGATGCEMTTGAVATTGEALVLTSNAIVQWFAPDGSPLAEGADSALEGKPFTAPHLAPLLGGSFAFAPGGWRRTFDRLSLASAPAPDWLTSRWDWTLRITGGNRGYAMIPPNCKQLATCDQSLDVLAPSGRLCGRVTFHEDGPCSTGWLDQGWDGTVVQQTGCGFCTYRWWPRLLAGS